MKKSYVALWPCMQWNYKKNVAPNLHFVHLWEGPGLELENFQFGV